MPSGMVIGSVRDSCRIGETHDAFRPPQGLAKARNMSIHTTEHKHCGMRIARSGVPDRQQPPGSRPCPKLRIRLRLIHGTRKNEKNRRNCQPDNLAVEIGRRERSPFEPHLMQIVPSKRIETRSRRVPGKYSVFIERGTESNRGEERNSHANR